MNNINGIVRATMLDDNKRNNKSGILKKIDISTQFPIPNAAGNITGIKTIKSTITNISTSTITLGTPTTGTYGISNNALYYGAFIAPNGYYFINLTSLPSGSTIWITGSNIYNIINGVPTLPSVGDYYLDNINNKMYIVNTGSDTPVSNDTNLYIYLNSQNLYNIYDITGSGNMVVIANLNNPLLLPDDNVYSSNGSTTVIENGHLIDTVNGNYYNNNNIVDKVKVGDNIDLVYNFSNTNTYYKYL